MTQLKCSKCGEEKDIKEFQVYWHKQFKNGVKGKYYRRKICTKCFYAQRKENKGEPVSIEEKTVIDDRPKKFCKGCGEYYYLEDYYGISKKTGQIKVLKGKYIQCYNCRSDKAKDYQRNYQRRIKRRDRIPNVSNIGDPGTYSSEEQREITYAMMLALGFTLNEKLNIWWKPGYRNEDGSFVCLENYHYQPKKRTRRKKQNG